MSDESRILLKLTRCVTPQRANDVERMRRVLNKHGYDADPLDIEAAYSGWSQSLPSKVLWHPPGYLNDDQILEHLLKGMQSEASPVMATGEPAPPVKDRDVPRAAQFDQPPAKPALAGVGKR